MGQDAARVPGGKASPGRDIAGWGAFTTPLVVVALFVAGADWLLALAVGGLSAVVFTAVWVACRNDRAA